MCACMCLCCDNRAQKLRATLASMTCSTMSMWSLNHHQPIHHSHIAYIAYSYVCIIIDQNLCALYYHREICLNIFLFPSMILSIFMYLFLVLCVYAYRKFTHVSVSIGTCVFLVFVCARKTHINTTKSSINDLYSNMRTRLSSIHFRDHLKFWFDGSLTTVGAIGCERGMGRAQARRFGRKKKATVCEFS